MSPLKKQNSFEEKLKEQMDSMELKPSDALWSRIERNIQADSFEPKLQQKLSDYTVEPHQEVWEQVASQLPENKRRKGFLWFASVCAILLATFGAGYWMSHTTNSSQQVAQTTAIAPANQTPSDAAVSSSKPLPSKPIHIEQEPSVATPAEALVQTENNHTLAKPQSAEQNSSGYANQATAPASTAPKGRKLNRSSTNTSTQSLPQATRNVNRSVASNNAGVSNGLPPNASELNQTVNSNSSETPQNNGGLQTPIASTKSDEAKNNSDKPNNTDTKTNAEPKVILESVSILPPAPKDTFTETPVFRGNSYVAPEENFTNFSISAMAGANLTFMQLSMPQNSSYTGLQHAYDLRKEIEKPALDFSGGLTLNYHFGKSWFVFSGIGISSFKQDVTFAVLPANQSNPPRIQPVNLYMNANDSIISGPGNSYENKYSFTEIPLWLGYQFPSDKKVHLELMGGVSYGRLNLVSAYMPDPGCIGMLVINDKSSFPTFKNVFFLGIAPAVSFNINSSVDVGGMISAKVALNSMVDNSNWIQQKPASTGVNLFLRKRF
jgi:hypothetical protein